MRRHGFQRGRRAGGVTRTGAHDRWMVSYADFITLMFAFFTVLYAVSTVDKEKLAPAASSLQNAFAMGIAAEPEAAGTARDARHMRPAPVVAPIVPTVPEDNLEGVRRRLALELADAIDSRRLEITKDARGLVLSLPVEATFAVGSADVQPDALALVARLAAALQPLGNAVRIEGHTDDKPIHTPRYGSNWELSTARASAVVAFLIKDAGMEPQRLSAAGYGEFHPKVPNDGPANRARNRRVDLVVLNSATVREEPAATEVDR
jgi:chemotaxis protein MotB